MTLSLVSALDTLRTHNLLREVITPDQWSVLPENLPTATRELVFSEITYDSRSVTPTSLLFCKGHFLPSYIQHADQVGLSAYISEHDFSQYTNATGIIVNDVRKAMSLLAAQFYNYPQQELKIAGITGTKGKTTTAYYVQALLNAASNGRAALLSSVDNCLDGKHYVESELTTPESLDLFRMMRQAVDHGMTYLVMEVSSQAYKMDRVFNLTFDVGVFLNISPDHISPVEHPSFEDYLYCKRQITYNSRHVIVGADHSYANIVLEDAKAAGIETTTFAVGQESPSLSTYNASVDWLAQPKQTEESTNKYSLYHHNKPIAQFQLAMDGTFNGANAAAAFAVVSQLTGGLEPPTFQAISEVRIAGRMERFQAPGMVAYVDYAHNYASTAALLDFLQDKYGHQHPYITVITGSAGGKAIDRRQAIVQATQTRANRLILTEEDTESEHEQTADICKEMLGYVSNPELDASIIIDRPLAISQAVKTAYEHPDRLDVIAVIGKGEERWIKRNGKHVPYEGDDQIITRLFQEVQQ